MGNEALQDYLKSLGAIDLLTAEEEIELAKRIENGDEAAKQRMVEANLKLVVHVCKKLHRPELDLLDLISSGNLGLYKAIEHFDYRKGFKFSTYATWWIRQAVLRDLANYSKIVRLPVHLQETIKKISKAEHSFFIEYGYPPTKEQLAEQLGIPVSKLDEFNQHRMDVASLSMQVGEEDSVLEDYIEAENVEAPEEEAILGEMKSEVKKLMEEKLTDRERFVIKTRYGFDGQAPTTLEDIGNTLGVSRERIRQIEMKAMNKLRRGAAKSGLRNFLIA